jgi:hypothetical protein
MTMPQPFSITAPTGTPEFSRSEDDIVITWEPSGSTDQMRIWVDDTIDGSRNCVRAHTQTLAGDTGSYTIAAGTIKGRENREDETCATTITVIRRRNGSLDPAYGEGGEAFARHYRTVQITSTP